MGINLLFTFNSGHNYTLSTGSIGQQGSSTGALVESDQRFANPLESVNESTTPWVFNLDARWYKDIAIGGLNTEIYIYVQNVLNTKNVINVYRRTGNASDDGFLNNPDLSSGTIAAYGRDMSIFTRWQTLWTAVRTGTSRATTCGEFRARSVSA